MEELPLYQKHSKTSKDAHDSAAPLRKSGQHDVLMHLKKGPATDEEIQDATGLTPSTQRPRRVELVEMGLVVDSGMRTKTKSGRMAVAWKLSDPGTKTKELGERKSGGWRARARRAEALLEQMAVAARGVRRGGYMASANAFTVPAQDAARLVIALDAVDGTDHATTWRRFVEQ